MHMKASENVNLSSLAAEAYEKARQDRQKAISRLAKMLLGERTYVEAVVGEIAYEAVRCHERKLRGTFFPNSQVPGPAQPSMKDAELRAAEETIKRWYSMPLHDGTKLGNALRGQLQIESEMHRAQARGNMIRARLYDAICERMPDEVLPVAEVLTEDEIEEIARGES